jgi:hypothetical protein
MHQRLPRLLHTLATITLLAGAAAAGTAGNAAADDPQKVGEVEIKVDEHTTDFGRLHLSAALLGYQLSAPDGGPVSTFGAFFELHSRLIVHGHATLPLLGFAGSDDAPYRLEGGVLLIGRDRLEVENEEVIISQTAATSSHAGEKVYANMPMVNRNRVGLDASLMVAHGSEKFDEADGTGTMTSRSTALMAAIGVGGIGSMGYTATVSGHGKRTNYRWNSGGLDVLVDLARSYDVEPAAKGSRFGGRLWAETLWFRHLGMSARAEIGKYPGHAGWVLVAALGGSLHL